ncbi:fatty acid--CoA ligase family protein [Desulfobulbus sp.]|uniref:class I adenylate-forming enzyme family protein n=1 Tax=Desulfobulbus sp. TaxID=895 RepID=UPI00286F3D01|nr:fatty acid--CoA ligase family protein [Desulfobulbus sp.]
MTTTDPGAQQTAASLLAGSFEAGREFVAGGATLGEVYGMAAWLGTRLGGTGQRGTVCLATDNRASIAAALLNSLAGGPVVLLPHGFSGQTLAGMRRATDCTVALADIDREEVADMEVVRLPWGEIAAGSPRFDARPDEELLRLYTGGSTGAPQLWPKTGTNLLSEAWFLEERFAVSPADRIVATVSPAHIYGLLYSVLLPLVSGASIVSDSPSFPEEIARTVRKWQATVLIGVPPQYRALRGKGPLGPSLRRAFSSAGMLDAEDNTEFCRHNRLGIVEVYGSTETGGIGLRNRFQGETGFTPYPTVDWHIRDERLSIRSPYLSPGLPRDSEGFFLTGDRVEPAGATGFQLKGRTDSITKVGGKRVDLEEIRGAIRQLAGVADCLVLALPDAGGREHRIVVLVEGERVTAEAIRAALAARFEPHALPRAVKTVERLPLKANGKVDREAVLRLFAP